MNKLLISKLYGVSRSALQAWVKKGTIYDEAAKKGIAISPTFLEEIFSYVNPSDFDDLSRFPKNKLTEAERIWFQHAFSYPGGPLIDPRPRKGALKGVYYDELRKRWKPRPYITIPG